MWEANARLKITYLKPYPSGYLPFNEGIINNLKGVFCHNNVLWEWGLKDPLSKEVREHFNFFDNEYWSCC